VETERKGPAIRKLYYSIGEVSEITGIPAHVLRYWETEFPQLRPKKGRTGNRTYQERDLEIISKIRSLLYEKRFTIAGAKAQIGGSPVPHEEQAEPTHSNGHGVISEVREELRKVLELLDRMSGRGAAR
jgi:DNA-binding transcriptional MerR regulator